MISLTALGNGATVNGNFIFTSMADGILSDRTATGFRINFGSDHYVDVVGTGFTYNVDEDSGEQTTPSDGTVTSYSIYQSGQQFDVTGLNEPVSSLNDSESVQALSERIFASETLVVSGAGHDYFSGGDQADFIASGAGHDYVAGGGGNDDLNGGDGDDMLFGGDGDDYLVAGNGDDMVDAGDGNNIIYGGAGYDAITAGAGDDFISGGSLDDSIYSGAGNDTVYGDEGDDAIYTEDGNDTVYAGDGNDSVYLSTGDDIFYGQDGDDYAEGGEGNDTMTGGAGNDYIAGGLGDDILFDAQGNDGLVGGAGNDHITSGNGGDYIHGGDGDDYIYAGNGSDEIWGGTGADVIDYQYVAEINDVIRDFSSTDGDYLKFEGVRFQDLPEGFLDSKYFTSNNIGLATHGLHKFIFKTSANQLFFDIDGNGTNNSPTLVATFVNGHEISASDIYIDRIQEGTSGDDTMHGGRYTDHFIATEGNDTYYGYEDADEFIYNDVAYGGDTIMDFNIFQNDQIHVKSENFGGLELGTLNADNFALNDTGLAEEADDFFIFNTENFSLYYDSDGSGDETRVRIASFEGLDEYSYLNNTSILVIA